MKKKKDPYICIWSTCSNPTVIKNSVCVQCQPPMIDPTQIIEHNRYVFTRGDYYGN